MCKLLEQNHTQPAVRRAGSNPLWWHTHTQLVDVIVARHATGTRPDQTVHTVYDAQHASERLAYGQGGDPPLIM